MKRLINDSLAPIALVALAISGLFNVFFLAGYFQARSQAGSRVVEPANVVRDVSAELRLDEEQQSTFIELRNELASEVREFDDAIAVASEDLQAALSGTSPSIDSVITAFREVEELTHRRRAARMRVFQRFIESLAPEQIQRIRGCMDRDRSGRRDERRREMMRRFDENGDGQLDEAERAKAEKFKRDLQQRFAQMEVAAQHIKGILLAEFDTNGNGQIDGDERPALRNRMDALLPLFDRDEDGQLDDGERRLQHLVMTELFGSRRGHGGTPRGRRRGSMNRSGE